MTPGLRDGRRSLLLIGAVLYLAALAWASAAPEPGRIIRKSLGNGLTLIFENDPSSPLTSLSLVIRGGQRAEPEGQAGLAFLTTRLLLEIPDSKSAQDLMLQASASGMAVQGDLSLITIESLSAHFEETLRIMTRPLLDPLFSGLRIDNIRKSMAHQGKLVEDDPARMGHVAQMRAVFGDSAYGASPLGSEETLRSIKGKHISEFYRTRFRAGNAVLAVVSDLDEGAVAAIINDCLKGFPSGPAAPTGPLKPFPEGPSKAFLVRKTNQTLISYGFRLPGAAARSYALAAMAENLLGKGPASRLWPLRQERMLAYNIDADVTPQKDAGLLEVYLETDVAKKDAAAAALWKVLEEARTAPVGPEELDALKSMTKSNFLRDNEAKDSRCQNLAVWEGLGLGAEYLQEFPVQVDSVTAEDLRAFLGEVLDLEHASTVVVGPKDLEHATKGAARDGGAGNLPHPPGGAAEPTPRPAG